MRTRAIRLAVCALAIALLAFAAAAQAAGVRFAVTPETLFVAPGDTINIHLGVPATGDPFNGFSATVEFDPAALTFLKQSQSVQEGPLLRAYCGNTFYSFANAADSLTISDTMLCNQGSVTGPGTLLNLRFVAIAAAPAATWVRIRRSHFYNDGLYVNPLVTSDGLIVVGGTLGVPDRPDGTTGARLEALPNPARGSCLLRARGAARGPLAVELLDALGRGVRHLAMTGAGVAWDGRDDAGAAVPPGVYLAVLRSAAGATLTRVVLLP